MFLPLRNSKGKFENIVILIKVGVNLAAELT